MKRGNQTMTNQTNQQITDVNMSGLLAYLQGGVSLATLEEGQFKAKLMKIDYHGAVGDKKEYFQMEYMLTSDNNRLVYERRYGKGIQIFVEQLQKQMGRAKEAVPVPEIMNYAQTNEFDVWIKYVDAENGSGVQFTNISLAKPITPLSTAIAPATTGDSMEDTIE